MHSSRPPLVITLTHIYSMLLYVTLVRVCEMSKVYSVCSHSRSAVMHSSHDLHSSQYSDWQ